MTGLSFGRTKLTVLFALLCVGQQKDVSSVSLLPPFGRPHSVCLHPTVRNSQLIFSSLVELIVMLILFHEGSGSGLTREDRPGGMGNLAAVSWETAVAPVCGQLFASVLSWWECLRAGDDQMLWESGLLQKVETRYSSASVPVGNTLPLASPEKGWGADSALVTQSFQLLLSKICCNQLHQCFLLLTDTVSLQSGSGSSVARWDV